MSTKYIASNWRLPNQQNSSKSDNYGLTFDGSVEKITFDTITLGTNYTLSAWAKRDSTANMFLFGNSQTYGYGAYFNGTSNLYFKEDNLSLMTFNNAAIQTALARTDWVHWLFIKDATAGTVSIYVDGVLAQSVSGSGMGNINAIGGSGLSTGTQYIWNGSISEVAIFDYALSATQISTLYGSSLLGAGNPMALPTPVAYYPLGDNSASNPLTQPNEAVEDASVFNFDGSDYIDFNSSINLGINSTISFWHKTSSNNNGLVIFGESTYAYEYLLQWGSSANKVYFRIGSVVLDFTGVTEIQDGNWHHYCVVRTGADGELFIDGASRSTVSGFSTGTNTLIDTIGATSSGTSNLNNSELTQVALWNSDQSSEISNIYNSGVPATSYTNTPTAWYKLDQSANWEADSSGAWQIPDAVSAYPQSFNFDGSNKITGTGALISGNESRSFSLWYKTSSTAAQIPFSLGSPTDQTNGAQFAYCINRSSTTNAAIFGKNSAYDTSVFTVPNTSDGNWHHLLVTYDQSALKVFIDGNLEATPALPSTSYITSAGFTIGGWTMVGNRLFNGEISNVAVWNSDQSSEISNIYNSGVPALSYTNTPTAWWKLDNTATFSTNWSIPDASGNGNTGTSSGMTEQNLVNNNVSVLNGESSGMTSANLVLSDLTRAVPYDGYSFNFDSASSDYIALPTITEVNSATACTLSYWGKKTASNKYLVFGSQIGLQDGIWLSWWSDGNVYFSPRNGASSGASYALSFNTNWHHFVGVYDGSSANIYIDGNLVSTSTTSIPSSLSASAGTDFNIGYLQSQYTNGKMSNLSIFDQALTSTEVMKLYSNGVPQDLTSFTPQPVAFYTLGSNSFWNGSNWICRDLIGSNDGTSVNAGVDAIVGDSPRSSANGVGSNNSIPENLEGSTKYSSNNSWSINMSETARVEDTP